MNKRNPYSKGAWGQKNGGGRDSKKKKASALMMWRTQQRDNEKKQRGEWGSKKQRRRKKGCVFKRTSQGSRHQCAVGKWRERTFSCDILLRWGTQSKTGHYANRRHPRHSNHYLSHFTCSAYSSLYIQTELHPIQVYGLNIQLIKINEIYLEKNMLLA